MDREREIVVPPPEGRWRRAIPVIGIVWVVVHLAIPLRYYQPDRDAYDERFAWRMFSAVRVQHCEVTVTETSGGRASEVPLYSVLPAPWVALMERNRAAVVERFLRWRCASREGVDEIRFVDRCADASGDALPPLEQTIDCETGAIEGTDAR